MGFIDVRGLGDKHLAHRKWQIDLDRFCVRFDGLVFALFRSCQQAGVAPAESRFQIPPGAKKCAGGSTAFLYIVYAFLVKD